MKPAVKFNKANLIDIVHAELGGTKVQAEKTVDLVLNTIVARVDNGEKVTLGGFGIFVKKVRKGRPARNPRTGEIVQVPDCFRLKFSPAKKLKDIINQAKQPLC